MNFKVKMELSMELENKYVEQHLIAVYYLWINNNNRIILIAINKNHRKNRI